MPISHGVAYVYSSTRVVRAVVGGYYACIVAHTCGGSIRAVLSNSGVSILSVYSTRHALGCRYCIGTCVRGVPLRGWDLTPVPNSKLRQPRPRPFRAYPRLFCSLFSRWLLSPLPVASVYAPRGDCAEPASEPLPFRQFVRIGLISAPGVRVACPLADTSASRSAQGGEVLSHTYRWDVSIIHDTTRMRSVRVNTFWRERFRGGGT